MFFTSVYELQLNHPGTQAPAPADWRPVFQNERRFRAFSLTHNDLVIGTNSAGLSVALALFNAALKAYYLSAMQ